MSLILCPECGTKISEKARTCPHCGFMSDDNSRPISEQDTYEIVPTFCYDIKEWKPTSRHLSVVAVEDNKSLVQFLVSGRILNGQCLLLLMLYSKWQRKRIFLSRRWTSM